MGAILADCLVGLPLMRELNLRDNMLTDKGLRPIVKVRSSLSQIPREDGRSFSLAAVMSSVYAKDKRSTTRRTTV